MATTFQIAADVFARKDLIFGWVLWSEGYDPQPIGQLDTEQLRCAIGLSDRSPLHRELHAALADEQFRRKAGEESEVQAPALQEPKDGFVGDREANKDSVIEILSKLGEGFANSDDLKHACLRQDRYSKWYARVILIGSDYNLFDAEGKTVMVSDNLKDIAIRIAQRWW